VRKYLKLKDSCYPLDVRKPKKIQTFLKAAEKPIAPAKKGGKKKADKIKS
jgi:hypothetical protein